jgi:hypothetical protein
VGPGNQSLRADRDMNPGRTARSLVTALTGLSQLLTFMVCNCNSLAALHKRELRVSFRRKNTVSRRVKT